MLRVNATITAADIDNGSLIILIQITLAIDFSNSSIVQKLGANNVKLIGNVNRCQFEYRFCFCCVTVLDTIHSLLWAAQKHHRLFRWKKGNATYAADID